MRQKRWKAPVLHTLDRMEDFGFGFETMKEKIEEVGVDGLQREMGFALGVLKKEDLQ